MNDDVKDQNREKAIEKVLDDSKTVEIIEDIELQPPSKPVERHPMYELKLKLDQISPGWYRHIDWNSQSAWR